LETLEKRRAILNTQIKSKGREEGGGEREREEGRQDVT
jgi:hypothetical protein